MLPKRGPHHVTVDHAELEPFEPLLSGLMHIAFTSGISSLGSVGFKMADIYQKDKARRRFIRGCHYGYDKAQQRIGAQVIDLEAKIVAAEHEAKQFRRGRDARVKQVLDRIRVLKNRQLVLRRIMDGILWVIIAPDTWILRRLGEDQIRRIDPTVLRRTTALASARNRESRYRFNVVADLTTLVHIGDLVEVIILPRARKRWRVIEIKEGKMNETISGLLKDKEQPFSRPELEQIRLSLGDHAAKQARRMMAQESRMSELARIIETDRGRDFSLKMEIWMTPESVELEQYFEPLAGVVDRTHEAGIAGAVIDQCLRLVGIKSELIDKTGGLGAVAHVFFHLANPERGCKLSDTEEAKAEVKAFALLPPIIDLVGHNMRCQWGTPIPIWPMNPSRVTDLLMGRIRLFAQFDIEAFFKLVEASGLRVRWVVGKEAEELRKISRPIPGSPNALGARVEHPDGFVQKLASGFFARVISDLTSPRFLLTAIKRAPEQLARMKEIESGEISPARDIQQSVSE